MKHPPDELHLSSRPHHELLPLPALHPEGESLIGEEISHMLCEVQHVSLLHLLIVVFRWLILDGLDPGRGVLERVEVALEVYSVLECLLGVYRRCEPQKNEHYY